MANQSFMGARPGARHVAFVAGIDLLFGCFCLLDAIFGNAWSRPPTPASTRVFIGLLGLSFIAMYAGLSRFRKWGRTLSIVMAVVLIFAPLSWYVLWVMLRKRTVDLFNETDIARKLSSNPG